MEIVLYPHPALRWKSRPVQTIDQQLKSVVNEMFELMYANAGIGLAANQVAYPYRVFVLNLSADPDQKDEELVFINPEIVRKKGNQVAEEGCLSFPKMFGDVRRSGSLVVSAFDLDGNEFELDCEDLASRAVQHETDHLDGVLFIDRMADSMREKLDNTIHAFELDFQKKQLAGDIPSNEELLSRLRQQSG